MTNTTGTEILLIYFVFICSDRFPYYKSNDDRWKNSVRHNLSINPHFRKGSKAAQGAGHLWTISTRDSESNVLAWEHVTSIKDFIGIAILILCLILQKKQRFDLFFKMEKSYSLSVNQTQPQQTQSQSDSSHKGHIYDEAAIAAANLSLINKQSSPEPNKQYNQQKVIAMLLSIIVKSRVESRKELNV